MPPPDQLTIIYCVKCRRATNGKGWFGAECQCRKSGGDALRGAHSAGTRPPLP